jgi:hypothetical protein
LDRDKFQQLCTEFPEFKYEIDKTIDYMKEPKNPIISFAYFRDLNGNVTPKEIFKMTVLKVMYINREFLASGIKEGLTHVINKMEEKNKLGDEIDGESPRYMTSEEKTHYLLKKIDKKVSR